MQQTPAYDQYNETLLDMIPKGLSRITEIGCMRENLTQAYLATNTHCQWTGIDIEPDKIGTEDGKILMNKFKQK